ncbi:lysophospholipid acyltransferase family protein [Hasllibacter halocynthiae]|nr:lysophospholipid acyltransferase family protein [Hasllibacter halocynthiae]
MARSFRAVRLLRPGLPALPEGAPTVVYSNHPSWWDPAFHIVLTTTFLPRHTTFGPIDAEALERYGFMKRIGLFGVEPGSRAGAARFLEVGRHVLADPARTLWMTAQGTFADPRAAVPIRAGLAHLMARVPGTVAVPLALEYPFWGEKRPEALAAFGAPVAAPPSKDVPRAVRTRNLQAALQRGLDETMERLSAAARERDPAAFEPVLGGRRGVGGVYGAWKRVTARAAGRAHDPDHIMDHTT